jgi:hypothetical protein
VSFLDDHPVLKKAVANQYQAILVAGATAFSALTLSPLPLLLLAGAELMAAPFLFDRLKRRLEIEKKFAQRQFQTLSQEQQFAALSPQAKARFERLRQLCQRIQGNYRGLSPASQGVLAEQEAKFDGLLASCLRRLWLLQKYDEMIGSFDEGQAKAGIAKLEQALVEPGLDPRVKEARQKNLEIMEQLLDTVKKNVSSREALQAELDSLENLLQLLLQKSIAATDAAAFSLEMDDVLSQVEADAASVAEMEQLLGSLPDTSGGSPLSDKIKQALMTPLVSPPASPPPRDRARDGGRRR